MAKLDDFEGSFQRQAACTDSDEPQLGIGEVEDIERAAKSMLEASHRSRFHPAMGSLIFLCFLFDGLHRNFIASGASKEPYFVAPLKGRLKTKGKFLSLETTSIMRCCCDLLIGVVITSSDKPEANSLQVQKPFETLMVTLQGPGHGEHANLLDYNTGPAIDWLNGQQRAASFVFIMLDGEFESPGRSARPE
ncbi:endogenous Bornavirus-like nucleoprotein 2 [Sturnira hondurensis]|uniref:endogenous Bornavirus-like nucleoprotein 2 n=1 Tax=Sturnira hondurensis TaxID=192404 RepID=UPI00187A6A96|nr:endogenous Bornavirus-like nucleoprotein 2 [Sturnira hondurensis]